MPVYWICSPNIHCVQFIIIVLWLFYYICDFWTWFWNIPQINKIADEDRSFSSAVYALLICFPSTWNNIHHPDFSPISYYVINFYMSLLISHILQFLSGFYNTTRSIWTMNPSTSLMNHIDSKHIEQNQRHAVFLLHFSVDFNAFSSSWAQKNSTSVSRAGKTSDSDLSNRYITVSNIVKSKLQLTMSKYLLQSIK